MNSNRKEVAQTET